jgi:hypothetical protein
MGIFDETPKQKWNFINHEYEPYETPDEWVVPLVCRDMDLLVNCANCGKQLIYGETFTSKAIHNITGLGFGVCSDCYAIERELDEIERKHHA